MKNINEEIFNKMPATWTQLHVKRIMHHDQVGFTLECTDGSPYENHISILIAVGEAFEKSQQPFMIKTYGAN